MGFREHTEYYSCKKVSCISLLKSLEGFWRAGLILCASMSWFYPQILGRLSVWESGNLCRHDAKKKYYTFDHFLKRRKTVPMWERVLPDHFNLGLYCPLGVWCMLGNCFMRTVLVTILAIWGFHYHPRCGGNNFIRVCLSVYLSVFLSVCVCLSVQAVTVEPL